ncbi:hypothetical protein HYPSUDRAFT_49268 [Hypholoma sublateritium FD-334 SS-4]|uniref:F-box domain-containing protein n=1 Tax=Hypholoma sublateritium (strain FD-334 SS-4) TaxID=945553 RepID=A0A0D2KIA2_HYPSF|nr:hypothetical protein HYPSUDRAFT_49268 [Hypholoma sublateritium FD-334 SS-4]
MNIDCLPSTTDDYILDRLSPAELYKYARTCKAAHDVVHAYIRRKYQLHTLLVRYFGDSEIREFLLQFFDRTVYPDSDLDLYVEHRYRKSVAIWLSQIGYVYVPHPTSKFRTLEEALSSTGPVHAERGVTLSTGEDPEYYEVVLVLTFAKQRPYRKIQVITSFFNPLSSVPRFHSTCVMNIITHNKAYSFFPRATFGDRRRSLKNSMNTSSGTQVAYAKYESREWEIIGTIDRDDFDGANAAFPTGLRRVGDSKCWTIPIYPDLALPEGYIESNAWLRASYIFPDDQDLWDWISEITKRGPDGAHSQIDRRYDEAYASLIRWYFDMYC